MFTCRREDSAINARGRGQTSYLLLGEGDFGSAKLAITWVECEPGSEQTLHTHASAEQVYVIVKGAGTMLVGDQEQAVEEGTMIFIPPGTPHAIRAPGASALAYVSATSPPFPAVRDGAAWTPLET